MRHPAPFIPRPFRHLLLLFALPVAVLSSGCATTQLPPISTQGASFRPLPDEVELWAETRAEEEEILDGFPVVFDPLLGDYLQQLVERLAPAGLLANPERRISARIRSLRRSVAALEDGANAAPLLDDAGFRLVVRPRPPGSR